YHFAEGDLQHILRSGSPPRLISDHPAVNTFALNVGLGNRVEIGMARVNTGERRVLLPENQAVGGTSWIMNMKVALLPPRSPFHLVGGAIDVTNSLQRTPYVYASGNIGRYLPNSFLTPRRLELGAGWGTGIINGVFVNAGLPVTPNIELMFEWLNNDLLFTEGPGNQFNLGARLRFSRFAPGLAIDLATIDLGRPSFGLSYTYCHRRRKRANAPAPAGVLPPVTPAPGKGTPPTPPPAP